MLFFLLQCVACRVVDFHNNGGDALAEDAYLAGGTPREVNDATATKGAAVGHSHNDDTIIGGIGHLEQRAKLMCAMGAGEAVVVQSLTAAGKPPGGSLAIVGGNARLRLADGQTKG